MHSKTAWKLNFLAFITSSILYTYYLDRYTLFSLLYHNNIEKSIYLHNIFLFFGFIFLFSFLLCTPIKIIGVKRKAKNPGFCKERKPGFSKGIFSDFFHFCNDSRRVGGAENGRTCNGHIHTGRADRGKVGGFDATIRLNKTIEPQLRDLFF